MATKDRGIVEDAQKYVEGVLTPYAEKLQPYIKTTGKVIDACSPYVDKAFDVSLVVWKKLEPYHPEEFLPALFGLYLVFFGGQFPLIVAAVEAFRLTGWDTTKASLIQLWESYKVAKAASDKDDLIDADHDGVPDVQQISKKQLLTRKMQVFMKSTDPVKVQSGIQGVSQGLVGVIAALKLKFAQAVTLGISLADIFKKFESKFIRPMLEVVVPKEYHKWLDLYVQYLCRSIAVSIVWFLQRIISAFHSSMRGAQMFILGVVGTMRVNGMNVPMDLNEEHKFFPPVVFAVGMLGFYFQISTGFELMFPFNILAIPFRILEWYLRLYITQ